MIRRFMVLDVLVAIFLLALFSYVHFIHKTVEPLPPPIKVFKAVFYVSEILFGSSLAFTAIYLARFIKTVTGNKPNLCLLIWHITNVFIYAVTLITITVT